MTALVALAIGAAQSGASPAAIKAQLLQGMGIPAAMSPSQQNLDAVKPYTTQLAPLLT